MTDFRALCAELLDDYGQCRYRSELHDRACAALAELEPVGPMDKLDRLIALDRDDPANALPMTDHIPNDLSHLSEEEFHSLCPQGEHAPGPEPLSPAAQAVLDAWESEWCKGSFCHEERSIVAALRAAVKQTRKRKVLKTLWVTMVKGPIYCLEADLLAIADELEGAK